MLKEHEVVTHLLLHVLSQVHLMRSHFFHERAQMHGMFFEVAWH